MKLDGNLARNFQTSLTDMRTTDFRMKASPQAFRILSDSLYKNPVLAVVRELCANAWDSHVKRGNTDRPFVVHTPTTLEPYFYVRDFGVGMEHEFVHSNYITFFESDKDHSDEAIGGFGLGSKAPFAYADQFTTQCFDGTTRHSYQLMITAGSNYQLMDRGTEPCTEELGVCVRIPVAGKDFEEFERAIKAVCPNFPTTPVCNMELPERNEKPLIQFPDGSYVTQVENSREPFSVIMGFMPYNLNPPSSDMNNLFNGALRGYVLHAPIGYFDITPDREGIRFSETTKAKLTKVLDTIVNSLIEGHRSTCLAMANDRERYIYLYDKAGGYDNPRVRCAKLHFPDLAKSISDTAAPLPGEQLSLIMAYAGLKRRMAQNCVFRTSIDYDTYFVERRDGHRRRWNSRESDRPLDTYVYWVKPGQAYKHFFEKLYREEPELFPLLIISGADPDHIEAWATRMSYELKEVPAPTKADKRVRTITKREEFSPTVYEGVKYYRYSEYAGSMNAATASTHDAAMKIAIPGELKTEISIACKMMGMLAADGTEILTLCIPLHHNRVLERLGEEFGFLVTTSPKEIVDRVFKEVKIDRKMLAAAVASQEPTSETVIGFAKRMLPSSSYVSAPYTCGYHLKALLERLDAKAKHSRLVRFIERVEEAAKQYTTFQQLLGYINLKDIMQPYMRIPMNAEYARIERLEADYHALVKRYGAWIANLGKLLNDISSEQYEKPLLKTLFNLDGDPK